MGTNGCLTRNVALFLERFFCHLCCFNDPSCSTCHSFPGDGSAEEAAMATVLFGSCSAFYTKSSPQHLIHSIGVSTVLKLREAQAT